MHDAAEGVDVHAFLFFTPPVCTNELVRRERAAPAPAVSQAVRPVQPMTRVPASRTVPDDGASLREQVLARRLCGRLRATDRCPGECVTSQLARGVPLRELRGLDVFEEVQDGQWSS